MWKIDKCKNNDLVQYKMEETIFTITQCKFIMLGMTETIRPGRVKENFRK